MYELHTYAAEDGFRWGVIAENGESLGHGGQGYSNIGDMEDVLLKMFNVARGAITGVHVPWSLCEHHNSKNGRCYYHKLIDARMLARSLREAAGAPSPHDP